MNNIHLNYYRDDVDSDDFDNEESLIKSCSGIRASGSIFRRASTPIYAGSVQSTKDIRHMKDYKKSVEIFDEEEANKGNISVFKGKLLDFSLLIYKSWNLGRRVAVPLPAVEDSPQDSDFDLPDDFGL